MDKKKNPVRYTVIVGKAEQKICFQYNLRVRRHQGFLVLKNIHSEKIFLSVWCMKRSIFCDKKLLQSSAILKWITFSTNSHYVAVSD